MRASMRTTLRVSIATIFLVLIAACGGPAPPGGGGGSDEGSFGPDQPHVADDGTTVATSDPDATTDPGFEVEVDAEPDVPVPDGVEVVGPVRRVTADVAAASSSKTPFVVGLPLPGGEDPSNLAVALLDRGPVEFRARPDEDAFDGTRTWVFLDAHFDPDLELLFASVPAITPEGWDVVLVRSDRFDTPSTVRPADLSEAQIPTPPIGFEADCSALFDASGVVETCGTTEQDAAATELENVFDDLTALGFTDDPRLTLRPHEVVVEVRSIAPPRFSVEIVPGAWIMELRPASQVNNAGMYSSGSGSFWAAIGTAGVTDGTRTTIRHEHFHATQYGYDPDLSAGWLRARFSIEGQAVLSEDSVPNLSRDGGFSPRAVDDTLLRSKWDGSSWRSGPFSEYQSQDFWRFLGAVDGASDLGYVVPFTEEGMAPEDVDEVLERDWSATYADGLQDAFWDWVKNQAFESRHDLGGALNGRCTYFSSAAGPTDVTPGPDGSASTDVDLDELEAAVIRFEASNAAAVDARYEFSTSLPSTDLHAKFYDPEDAGSDACWSDSELPQTTVSVAPGASEERYLLVANVGIGTTETVEARIEPAANLDIVSPEGTFRVGDTLSFRADLTGVQDPGSIDIQWSATDSDGSDVGLPFTTRSGDTETYADVPCDDLTIRAEATVASGTVSSVQPVSCEPPVETYRYEVDRSISGMVTSDGRALDGSDIDDVLIGDDANDVGLHGLLHFGLPTLPDDLVQIESATLVVSFETPVGTPFSDFGELNVVHVDYGDTLDASNYRVAPTDTDLLPGLTSTSDTDFGTTEIDVTTHVRDAWDARATRGRKVQVMPYVGQETDNDGNPDQYVMNFEDRPGTTLIPALEVTFRNYHE